MNYQKKVHLCYHNRKKKFIFFQKISTLISCLLIGLITACPSNHKIDLESKPEVIASQANMEILTPLLFGDKKNVTLSFIIDQGISEEALSDFKLRVAIIGQESLNGVVHGSKISYKNEQGIQESFSDNFEKPLSSFKHFISPHSANEQRQHIKLDINLLPIDEAIRLNLSFELLDKENQSIKRATASWLKSKVAIIHRMPFKDNIASFVLKNLAEDITDLNELVVKVQPVKKEIKLTLGETNKDEASLAELLPNINQIAKNQETDPIKIHGKEPAGIANSNMDFLIFVFPKELSHQKIRFDMGVNQTGGAAIVALDQVQQKIRKEQEINQERIVQLQQQKIELQKEIQEAEKAFKKNMDDLKKTKKIRIDHQKNRNKLLQSVGANEEYTNNIVDNHAPVMQIDEKKQYKKNKKEAQENFNKLKKAKKEKIKENLHQQKELEKANENIKNASDNIGSALVGGTISVAGLVCLLFLTMAVIVFPPLLPLLIIMGIVDLIGLGLLGFALVSSTI